MNRRSFLKILSVALLTYFINVNSVFGAITQASLTSGSDNVDNSSFATASITPTANRLILAAIYNSKSTAPAAPTLSGNGLTWVSIATIIFNEGQAVERRISLFRAMGASPSAGAMTIDFAGVNQTSCGWSIFELDGIDTSGTNGSGAIVQSVTNELTVSGTSLTVTLAAFGSTDNGAVAVFGVRDAVVITPDTGWTEIHDINWTLPGSALETQWRADNDTTAVASWTGNEIAGGIAAEIKVAAVGGATPQRALMGVGL